MFLTPKCLEGHVKNLLIAWVELKKKIYIQTMYNFNKYKIHESKVSKSRLLIYDKWDRHIFIELGFTK